MFIQPENKINRELGGNIGSLGGALERLANQKFQQMEEHNARKSQLQQMFQNQQIQQMQQQQEHQKYSKSLAATGNFTPQQADVIAWQMLLNPQSAPHVIEGFFNTGVSENGQQGQPTRADSQGKMYQAGNELQGMNQVPQDEQANQAIMKHLFPYSSEKIGQQSGQPGPLARLLGTPANAEVAQPTRGQHPRVQQIPQEQMPIPQVENKPTWGSKAIKAGLEREKLEESKKMHAAVRTENAYKATEKFREEINELHKATNENARSYANLERLNNSGALIYPMYGSLLKAVHLDYPWFMGTGTEEFEKEAAGLQKGIKSIYGPRPTNLDVQQFLKMIPGLSNSQQGRAIILNNLKRINDVARQKAGISREIIKTNGNVPPLDLMEQVQERMDPLLSDLEKSFETGNEALPAASEHKDEIYLNDVTGMRMKSDGKKWDIAPKKGA